MRSLTEPKTVVEVENSQRAENALAEVWKKSYQVYFLRAGIGPDSKEWKAVLNAKDLNEAHQIIGEMWRNFLINGIPLRLPTNKQDPKSSSSRFRRFFAKRSPKKSSPKPAPITPEGTREAVARDEMREKVKKAQETIEKTLLSKSLLDATVEQTSQVHYFLTS